MPFVFCSLLIGDGLLFLIGTPRGLHKKLIFSLDFRKVQVSEMNGSV